MASESRSARRADTAGALSCDAAGVVEESPAASEAFTCVAATSAGDAAATSVGVAGACSVTLEDETCGADAVMAAEVELELEVEELGSSDKPGGRPAQAVSPTEIGRAHV